MWCLSRDQPPRLEGSSSKPWSRAVLFSHRMRLGQVSYSNPTDTVRQRVWDKVREKGWLSISELLSKSEKHTLAVTPVPWTSKGGWQLWPWDSIPRNPDFELNSTLKLYAVITGRDFLMNLLTPKMTWKEKSPFKTFQYWTSLRCAWEDQGQFLLACCSQNVLVMSLIRRKALESN